MAPDQDRPISDPLLRPEGAPRDARGTPVRAPVGNSIMTFVLLVVLVGVGVAVWWWRRPADVTDRLGGREWVITDVDGEPALNSAGTVSTFVLDGTGEVRGVVDCNVATGSWSFEAPSSRLAIDWTTQTDLVCDEAWPATFLPEVGSVDVGDGTLIVDSDAGSVRAFAPVDVEPVTPDEMAGDWVSGGSRVEIGQRGRFTIDECRGGWREAEASPGAVIDRDTAQPFVVRFDPAETDRVGCDLDERWFDDTPVVAVVHDGSLYLRRDRSIFPIDRWIVRLDPADGAPVPQPP